MDLKKWPYRIPIKQDTAGLFGVLIQPCITGPAPAGRSEADREKQGGLRTHGKRQRS